ncbi:MAG: ABC transporter ATP-binding protein, partial [Victivallales bacterium]|nr:ABC transporter ATP-binding protein [Victivallales bacterium]
MCILDVMNLSVEFQVDGAWLPAVTDLSFNLEKGQILALVGESGCGKSVTCLSLARLLPEPPARYTSGTITVNGESVLDASKKKLREIRRHYISYIFQEPSVSLNPVFRVGDQIAEALTVAERCDESGIVPRVIELLRQVGIPEPEKRMRAYPHELSGGMQQRVMIAMALAKKPEILVADEPTTALDVTIQAQILDLLRELRESSNMSIILVTHNLGIVSDFAEKMVVMYAGHAVEAADTAAILESPLHPYTRALLSAVPKLGHQEEKLATIPG